MAKPGPHTDGSQALEGGDLVLRREHCCHPDEGPVQGPAQLLL